MEQQNAEQVAQAAYAHVAQLMKAGQNDEQIVADLESRGFERRYALTIIANLKEAMQEQKRGRARKNIGFGAAWLVGGAVITAATYSAASGGGTYVVTWGAIIFGAIQMLAGLAQLNGSRA